MEHGPRELALIREFDMLPKGGVVLCAVSGGADSVYLLHRLYHLRGPLGYTLIAAHYNHHLRGAESDRDEQFVRKFVAQHCPGQSLDQLPPVELIVGHGNVTAEAKKRKQGIEETAREMRYAFLYETAEKLGANRIAVAHNADDNLETMLLHQIRGAGLRGLSGMPPRRDKLVRPLLTTSREEIEASLHAYHLPYVEDSSNTDQCYTRNRIRHKILPVMEQEINRQTVEHINRLSLQAEEIWEYLNLQADAAWRQMVHPVDVSEENPEEKQQGKKEEKPAGLRIEEEEYAELPGVLKSLLIRRCICEMAEAQKDIEAVHMEAVRGLFGRQVGKSRDLPYQLRAVRTYAGVEIRRRSEDRDQKKNQKKAQEKEGAGQQSVELKIPGETYFPGTGQKVCCEICGREEAVSGKELPQKSYTKCFDYDIIKSGLCIRYRRPGDELVIDSRGKRQKLKSYFINEKVPKEKRDRILLIAEEEQIVWIPGMRMSAAYQIGDQTTKILKIKIVEE